MSESAEVAGLMSVPQAIEVIDAAAVVPRVARVRIEDAPGLRLAGELRADRDYPPFDKSLMDGYAVRVEDVRQPLPLELEVAGEVAAGGRAGRALGPGQAMAIMTGAPLPEGADGVVPVEDTAPVDGGPSRVRILHAADPSRYITRRGADCREGQVVLSRGTKLEAAQLAAAGSVGAAEVDVYARPRAAVLSTGDELVPIAASPGPSQIRNSNNLMLAALLRRWGAEVDDLGVAPDRPEMIRQAVLGGLERPVLFISGGMSMGRYDFVPRILVELGVELRITKLRIKPGKPFVFGVWNGAADGGQRYVFGLPGNPVSSFVCAVRLCSRLIERLSGAAAPAERWIEATLQSPLERNGPREFYQPAVLSGTTLKPLRWKGSADLYTLATANALLVRQENEGALPAGQRVRALEV